MIKAIQKDVIIIGAGASGLMCALEAGKRGRSVVVLDHGDKPGRKILVSGGGHCNFTNIYGNYENYLSDNPGFCRSALSRFSPQDIISMAERHGIQYYEKENGQMFCKGSSREIAGMFKKECAEAGVDIILNCCISGIKKEKNFILSTTKGMFESESLVIASGGLSYTAIGATDFGYRLAEQFGLKTGMLKPGLVPLVFNTADLKQYRDLSGISVDTIVSCNKKHFRGNILFTHRGLSGPAILQASLYWNKGDDISIDLLPDTDIYKLFIEYKQTRSEMHNLLSGCLPKRLSQKWCETYTRSKPVCQYTDKELKNMAEQLHNWTIRPAGTEGYIKAEVTLGGIDTGELSSKTMESKKIPGLYFIGEVVDVTGQLGGYNLQWAWSSGYAAGQFA